MKKFTIPLSLIVFTSFLFSCNSNRKATSSKSFAANKADTTEVVKAEDNDAEECVNKGQAVSSGAENSDKRLEQAINMGGYNYSYTQPNANFQGASGPGTGSSYASNYYGSSAKKEKKKVCTVEDSSMLVTPGTEQTQNNFYTTSQNRENKDEVLQEKVKMGQKSTDSTNNNSWDEWETADSTSSNSSWQEWPNSDTTNSDSWQDWENPEDSESDNSWQDWERADSTQTQNWQDSEDEGWSIQDQKSMNSDSTSSSVRSFNKQEQNDEESNYENLPW